MTGVEGREELIFEGSNDLKEWKPYEFYYKPGATDVSPRNTVPH